MTTKQKIEVHQKPQFDMFSATHCEKQKATTTSGSSRRFTQPDPADIHLSGQPLQQHLEMIGDNTPFAVSDLSDEQD